MLQIKELITNQTQTLSNGNLLKILSIIFVICTPALSAENADGYLILIKSGIKNWIPFIKGACLYIFWALVAIDLAWTFGKMGLTGFELGELIVTLIKKVIFIGVIIFLFNVDYWLNVLFSSFSQLATNVSGSQQITPNNIISKAIDIVLVILKSMSITSPGDSFFKVISGLIILIAFVFMAIDLLLIYVKFYLMQVIIFFALALSGLERFKELGINPILAAVKIGIELFTIQALMALCIKIMQDTFQEISQNSEMGLVLGIMVIALIFCIITKMVPGLIEAIFNGGLGSDNGSAAAGFKAVAAMTGAMAASAAVGAVGITRAMKAAKDLHFAEGGAGGLSAIGGIGKNLAATTSEHLRDNLVRGRMPNDIASRLQEKTKAATNARTIGGTISAGEAKNEPYVSGINNA